MACNANVAGDLHVIFYPRFPSLVQFLARGGENSLARAGSRHWRSYNADRADIAPVAIGDVARTLARPSRIAEGTIVAEIIDNCPGS